MLTFAPKFFTFLPSMFVCFVNIMEFYATVIEVRDLGRYKTKLNATFSTYENVCTKSGI